MESVQHTSGEGIACACRTLAVTGRNFERSLLEAEAFGGRADGAMFGVDGDGLLHAEGEQLFGGSEEPTSILGVDDFTEAQAGFDLVDDEVVGEGQGAERDFAKLRVRGAAHVDGGLEAGGAGVEEQLGRDGLAIFEGVHAVEQHEVAEVQDAGVGLAEGAVLEVEVRVGAPAMEERAAPGGLHGHRVGVGGRVFLAEV